MHLSSVLNPLSFPAVHFRICNNVCKRFNHRIPPSPRPFSSPHPFITLLSPPVYPFLGLLSHLHRAANGPPIFLAPPPCHIRLIPKYRTCLMFRCLPLLSHASRNLRCPHAMLLISPKLLNHPIQSSAVNLTYSFLHFSIMRYLTHSPPHSVRANPMCRLWQQPCKNI